MSFRPGIPGWVALQQSPPPLSRPASLSARIFRSSKDIQRTATVESRLCLIFGLTPKLSARHNSTPSSAPKLAPASFFQSRPSRQNATPTKLCRISNHSRRVHSNRARPARISFYRPSAFIRVPMGAPTQRDETGHASFSTVANSVLSRGRRAPKQALASFFQPPKFDKTRQPLQELRSTGATPRLWTPLSFDVMVTK
jgi:hypothetical protein